MSQVKVEQDKDKKSQKILTEHKVKENFGTMTFGDHTVHAFYGKVVVPPSQSD
jgi:hypothetical protein